MTISICIPTYNRCFFLIDTLHDLFKQAIDLGVESQIEVCISNNASTDNTKEELEKLHSDFPQFKILVNHNETNIGADRNFIKVLSMSSGQYSILKGDDDYFQAGGLKYLLNMLNENPQIDFFISDVDIVNTRREFICHVDYLREKEQLIVDFSKEIEARNYFALCNSILPLGSFISAVIFKTEAVKSVEMDPVFIGSCYAFEFYFWKYLLNGHKLMYRKQSYIQAVMGTSNIWGGGIARDALDISAFGFIADYFFMDSPLRQDFKDVVNRMYKDYSYIPIDQRKDFKEKLYPALIKTNHPLIKQIKGRASTLSLLAYVLLSIMPNKIVNKIRLIIKRRQFWTTVEKC